MKDEVKIKISIDNQTTELKKIRNEFINLSSNIDKSSQKTEQFQDRIKAMGHIGAGIIGLNVSISALNSTVSDFVKKADEMKSVENRLKLVTSSTAELANIQTELFKISQNSMVLYTDTADLYSRMARSTKELNLSQAELLNVTDTISKTLIISGGSAESANAALEQLGQGFASGTLRGEELNSVMEQTPRLAQAIADGMGITVGQLRELGANGELTAQKIIEALKGQASIVGSEFSKMSITAEQGFTRVRNSTSLMISKLDESLGVTSNIAKSFSYASENVDSYIKSLSPEQIKNTTEYIKNMGIAVVVSYTAIKTAQGVYSIYNNILESNKKITQQNTQIEQERTKAIILGEQATKARKLADEAKNTAQISGLLLAENHYKMLNKEATALEIAAKKQQAYSYQLEATAKGFSASAFGANLLKGALSTIPFMAISIGISAIATSLLTASDNSEILEKTIKSTGEELSKLTKNQLEYRKALVETELIQARLDLSNAKAKAANGTLADKSYADEMSIKFEELTKSSRNVKEALADLSKQKTDLESKSINDSKPIVRDDSAIIKLMGSELSKFNLELDENIKKLQASGATEAEVDKYRADAIKKFNETRQKANEKLSKDTSKTADEINKAYLDISQIGMSDYNKSLISITEKTENWKKAGVSNNDILVAQSKLLDELNQKTSVALAKEDLSYYERLIQLKSDSLQKDQELAGISYSQKVLDIQDINRPIEEKEKLISLESELYSKTLERISLEHQSNKLDEVSNSYQDMLDSQISLIDATNDWNSNLTGTAASLADIASATTNISKLNLTNLKAEDKLRTEYEKNKIRFYDNEEKLKQLDTKYLKDKAALDEKNTSATLIGYSNIAAAVSNLNSLNEKEAASAQIVQTTLAMIEGTRAILTAGTGDPYSAIPRMLVMGTMVAGLLSNIGVAFGMNKTSTVSDAFSSKSENTGTGSVLGDNEAQSESIVNALDILKDYADPELKTLVSMNKYLKNISDSIGGVSSLLIQTGGFAFGEGFTASSSNKQKYQIGDISSLHNIGALLDPGLALSKMFGGNEMFNNVMGVLSGQALTNKILGGVFGKTSVSQALTDSGIYFADTLLLAATDEILGQAYQTVATVTTKKSWFGKSSNTTIQTYFDALDDETNRQFSLVLSNLYGAVLMAGDALDMGSEDLTRQLNNFVVSIGKISLNGKTGDEIREQLEAVFGKVSDDLAKTIFPPLEEFQKVGEGMFETLTRVAVGMEEAEYYTSRLGNRFQEVIYTTIGNKQGDIGFEALLQSIEKVEVATYPVNNNLYKVIENLDVTAEELYGVYTNLDELRDRLIFLGLEAQGLSSSMIYGAGTVTDLQSGFKSFFESFLTDNEQLTYKTEQLISQFNDLGIALPASKDSFRDLLSSLDLTTESGQELYGRLIVLSEGFAEVADATTSSIEALQTSLDELSTNSFDTFISSLDKVGVSISTIKNTALSFLQGLSTSNNLNLEEQIISYNKMRAEFKNYFDENGVIKSGIDENSVNSLYSKISSMATNIAGKDEFLKDSLISQFENDIFKFDLSDEIIKVNIVDGLGALYNLTSEQLTQLQTVASDGKITNDELNSITGLTQTQKDGILSFANNSNFFSTEGTLQNLATYTKLQLDAYNKSIAEETASLSKQSMTYDDYIGKQEKIDIARTLGISYETAEPLIKQLQSLSILDSSSQKSSLNEILKMDMSNFKYDKNTFNQLELFSPYLDDSIKNNLNILKTDFETSKLFRIKELENEIIKLEASKAPISPLIYSKYESRIKSYEDEIRKLEFYKIGQSANTIAHLQININGLRTNMNNVLQSRDSEISSSISLINSQIFEKQSKIKSLNSFATGSPRIEYDQLAHLHKDEIVAPKTFADGMRDGDLIMGNNNKVVEAIDSLKKITIKQAQEIQKMREALEEANTRDLIKTIKGAS